jgi:hypothetical protein
MKIEHALHAITPSELDAAKQDWRRDPTTWRARMFARCQSGDEIADALESYFAALPNSVGMNKKGDRY